MIGKLVIRASFVALLAGAPGAAVAAPLNYATVAVYDENVFQANAVDATAAGSNVTLAQFSLDVAAAFAANNGGVVTFDDGGATPDTAGDQFFTATYGVAQSASLVVTRIDSANFFNNNNNNAPALSGSATTNANGNYLGLAGAAPWAASFSRPLEQWGVTAISRNAERRGVLTINLTNSTSVAFPEETIGAVNDDTFFGYKAPAGVGIASVSWNDGGSGFSRFDDMAFIVGVPEPAAAALAAMGLLCLRATRRRRTCV
jgi:hypothetical protein